MTSTTHSNPTRRRHPVVAVVSVGYAFGCYLAFVGVYLYALAFLSNGAVPRTVDRGGPVAGIAAAVMIDSSLLALFAVQHSLMARPAFKRWWTRPVPRHVERSTYVLVASVVLALTFWQWRPIPTTVWDIATPALRVFIWGLFVLGWVWVLAMTCAFGHADFFGLAQVIRKIRGLRERSPLFALPLPHRLVRHPMMLGFMVGLTATPTMTLGHALLAGLGCAYILVGVRLEEHDLTRELPEYSAYANATPRFVPRPHAHRERTTS